MQIRNKTIVIFITVLITVSSLYGCATWVSREHYSPGKILVLPPRDGVQFGEFTSLSRRTGAKFQKQMLLQFYSTYYDVITTDSEAFNHRDIASKQAALAEGKQLGAEYVLQTVLGEFLDSPPRSTGTDYVWLESAVMWDVDTGKVLWQTNEPVQRTHGFIGNLAHFHALLNNMAKLIVAEITR